LTGVIVVSFLLTTLLLLRCGAAHAAQPIILEGAAPESRGPGSQGAAKNRRHERRRPERIHRSNLLQVVVSALSSSIMFGCLGLLTGVSETCAAGLLQRLCYYTARPQASQAFSRPVLRLFSSLRRPG